MFDLSSINEAKKKIQISQEKKEESFSEILDNAIKLLKQYLETGNTLELKQSASKFFEAIKCKRSSVEPYFYLSYIFYIFDENKLAIEYFKTAESINPEYSNLESLRNILSQG